MTAKTFEIRDKATFVPALAVKLEPGTEADRYLLARSGYGRTPEDQAEYIILWGLATGGTAHYDANAWDNATRKVAHQYIIEHFDELPSGSVVDVEFIQGLSAAPKRSESETVAL